MKNLPILPVFHTIEIFIWFVFGAFIVQISGQGSVVDINTAAGQADIKAAVIAAVVAGIRYFYNKYTQNTPTTNG